MTERNQVFISHSHQDAAWLERLHVHLKPLEDQGLLKVWSDTRIKAGSRWRDEIDQAMGAAKVAILLISADYLASDFIAKNELPPLLKAAEKEGAVILPVILSPCRFKQTPDLAQYQAVNSPTKALSSLDRNGQEQVFLEVSFAVEEAMKSVTTETPQPRFSSLPERNLFFTGRTSLFAQIKSGLAAQGRVALSGLGGVGKTQSAIEYAHRHAASYQSVFWVNAASHDALVSSYAALAPLLKVKEAADQVQTARAVKGALSNRAGWLLILDNADDLSTVREFIPEASGHVLLTTRAHSLGPLALPVEVQELPPDDATLFLVRRCRAISDMAPANDGLESENAAAHRIAVDLLGGLPLALDQAGAYIEECGCGLAGYAELYERSGPELLKRRGALTPGHPDPVATTWALSFENVERTNKTAADFLRICAFLSPDAIPEELFFRPRIIEQLLLPAPPSINLVLNDAVAVLLKYSLVRRDPASKTLEIHRLVQQTVRAGMNQEEQRLWAERTVRLVHLAFPNPDEFKNWAACRLLLPHAVACAAIVEQFTLQFPEASNLLLSAGAFLNTIGLYQDALRLENQALEIRLKVFGPNHPQVANIATNLSALYANLGKYDLAGLMARMGHDIKERVLGPDHPEVASSLTHLANSYQNWGDFAEAEQLLRRALAIRTSAHGPEDAEVAHALIGLANLFMRQGRYDEAEELLQRALPIQMKTKDRADPEVASTMNSLAGSYNERGRYAEAEPLYEIALEIRQKAQGNEHPDVATVLNNLASVYQGLNDLDKAATFIERALAIDEKFYGSNHPEVAIDLNNLAELYLLQDKPAEAEALHLRALAIEEGTFGPDHPGVALSLNNLGRLYANQGDYEKAEPMYQRALTIMENTIGTGHPHHLHCLENYARLLIATDRSEMGERLREYAASLKQTSK